MSVGMAVSWATLQHRSASLAITLKTYLTPLVCHLLHHQVYPFSYLYTYFVSVPHSILIQLASPTANKTYGEQKVHSDAKTLIRASTQNIHARAGGV